MKQKLLLIFLCFSLAACGVVTPKSSRKSNKQDLQKSAREQASIQTRLGLAYMRRGQHKIAMNRLEQAIALDPKSADAHGILATLYEKLDKPNEALSAYENAIEHSKENSAVRNNFGLFLCRQKQHEKAYLMFESAYKNSLYKTPWVAMANAGKCALDNSDEKVATGYFLQSLQVNDKHPPALLAMAKIAFNNQQYHRCRSYLARFSAVAAKTPEFLWLGIRNERILGDKNQISSYSLLLRNGFPDSDEAGMLIDSSK
jgi:type IV pilus assembly protein PilF